MLLLVQLDKLLMITDTRVCLDYCAGNVIECVVFGVFEAVIQALGI